jgi:hypothetical protein
MPKTAAELQARVDSTLESAGYGLRKFDDDSIASLSRIRLIDEAGRELARVTMPRRQHLALTRKAQKQLIRLRELLGQLEELDTLGLFKRVRSLKPPAEELNGWFVSADRRRHANTLAEIERELEWRRKALSGQQGRPASEAVNEWTAGLRKCGLSDSQIALANAFLGLEAPGNAKDRVRQRRRRHS